MRSYLDEISSSAAFSDHTDVEEVFGALGGIRTPDRLVRSQELYPAELPAQRKLIMLIVVMGVNFTSLV